MVVQRLACVQIKLLISRNSRIAGTFLAVLLLFGEVSAQIHTPPRPSPQYMNSVGAGASVGSFYDKGSYFFGAGFDYGRVLKGPWSFGLGVFWDREIEKPFDKPSKQVNSWTLVPTPSPTCSTAASVSQPVWDKGSQTMITPKEGRGSKRVILALVSRSVLACRIYPFLSVTALG